jgi:hypothetical protein
LNTHKLASLAATVLLLLAACFVCAVVAPVGAH